MNFPDAWRSVALGDSGTWFSGGTPNTQTPEYWGGAIPWISSGSLTNFRLWDSERRVTSEGVRNGTRIVAPGTILLVVRGMSLKSEFRIGRAMRPMAFGQDCKALVARPDIDSEFLAYAVSARTTQILSIVDEAGHGTGRLNSKQLYNIRVGVPPLPEQQAIAGVLRALDDKIAANVKLIDSVDTLAQAQFHAVLNGAAPEPLSGLAEFINGKAFTNGASGTGRVVIRIAELNSGITGSTVYSDANVDDKHVAHTGNILFAWSGSLTLHRWFRDEAIVNQHIFKVIPRGMTPAWLVYELLRNKLAEFRMTAANKATTMGHIQRKHLDEPVRVPEEASQRQIAPVMESLWQTALQVKRENLALTATREALLPPLLSGKLRVREVEQLIATTL